MQIHNSSLTFSPVGFNQKVGKNNSAQNDGLPVVKDAQNEAPSQPSSSEEIKNALQNNNLTIVSTAQNLNKPTDSRTLRALSAYNKQFNAPLQEQRAQLITGIDAYA